jgi:hypothetical protein
MVRVPEPNERVRERPRTLLKRSYKSPHSSEAFNYTVRVYRWQDLLCVQIEDQEGGAEVWVDADDFADLLTRMTDVCVEVQAELHEREGVGG